MATIKKAQNGTKTKDSTDYFKSRAAEAVFERGRTRDKNIINKSSASKKSQDDKNAVDKINNLNNSVNRQSKKGKPGYDANGFPLKKKMKNGGSLSGLKAFNKRDKGVDPKGAFTKVQKKTLAGAKGKASLTKDKQLGATKMAKKGMSIKKK